MARIEVPSETLVVEMGNDGLNIVETFMQMSEMDESALVQCEGELRVNFWRSRDITYQS